MQLVVCHLQLRGHDRLAARASSAAMVAELVRSLLTQLQGQSAAEAETDMTLTSEEELG